MSYSASASAPTHPSNFISALDSYTPTQLGEKGHLENGWSNDLREQVVQLSFQLVRTADPTDLGARMTKLLNQVHLLSDSRQCPSAIKQEYNLIKEILLSLTAQTRDVEAGKGEWTLSYELLKSWWSVSEKTTFKLIKYFVHDIPVEGSAHPLGSWKDIKAIWAYFGGVKCPERLQDYLINLINTQLKLDVSAENPTLCSRWVCREGGAAKSANTFKPLFQALAYDYFKHFIVTAKSDVTIASARRKAITHYRTLLSGLNKRIRTPQINMCGGTWSEIKYPDVPSVALRKLTRSFQNLDKKNQPRSDSEDRIVAADNFTEFVDQAIKGEVVMKGKRVGITSIVNDGLKILDRMALGLTATKIDIDAINLQWRDGGKHIPNLGKFVVMADTSGSMFGDPLIACLGLALRIAEKSTLGRRVMTFNNVPEWINLEGHIEFTDMLNQIRNTNWGMNTNFTAALTLILDVIVKNRLTTEEVEDMVLVILSDMQIDSKGNESLSEDMWGLIERLYSEAGIKLWGKPFNPPHILFWNLRSLSGTPITSKQKGATMMSGFSPALLNAFCEKGMDFLQSVTPWSQLVVSLDNPRYKLNAFE